MRDVGDDKGEDAEGGQGGSVVACVIGMHRNF
jgi:hypothetical protein